MYYNIKIKSNIGEYTIESKDKNIVQSELDLYFDILFKTSEGFNSDIDKIDIASQSDKKSKTLKKQTNVKQKMMTRLFLMAANRKNKKEQFETDFKKELRPKKGSKKSKEMRTSPISDLKFTDKPGEMFELPKDAMDNIVFKSDSDSYSWVESIQLNPLKPIGAKPQAEVGRSINIVVNHPLYHNLKFQIPFDLLGSQDVNLVVPGPEAQKVKDSFLDTRNVGIGSIEPENNKLLENYAKKVKKPEVEDIIIDVAEPQAPIAPEPQDTITLESQATIAPEPQTSIEPEQSTTDDKSDILEQFKITQKPISGEKINLSQLIAEANNEQTVKEKSEPDFTYKQDDYIDLSKFETEKPVEIQQNTEVKNESPKTDSVEQNSALMDFLNSGFDEETPKIEPQKDIKIKEISEPKEESDKNVITGETIEDAISSVADEPESTDEDMLIEPVDVELDDKKEPVYKSGLSMRASMFDGDQQTQKLEPPKNLIATNVQDILKIVQDEIDMLDLSKNETGGDLIGILEKYNDDTTVEFSQESLDYIRSKASASVNTYANVYDFINNSPDNAADDNASEEYEVIDVIGDSIKNISYSNPSLINNDFKKQELPENKKDEPKEEVIGSESENSENEPTLAIDFGLYLMSFAANNITDKILICAYYIKNTLNKKSFTVKFLNKKLHEASGEIASIEAIKEMLDKKLLIKTTSGNSKKQYKISSEGEKYFMDNLQAK